jgi:hypothetical protein
VVFALSDNQILSGLEFLLGELFRPAQEILSRFAVAQRILEACDHAGQRTPSGNAGANRFLA